MNLPIDFTVTVVATCLVCGPFAILKLVKALSQGGVYKCEKCGQTHFFRNH